MKHLLLATLSCFALTACLQERAAPIEHRGDRFYGQDATYDRGGNEVPRYSNRHRARLSDYNKDKFVDDSEHQYGVSAAVDSVGASDLPPIDDEAENIAPLDSISSESTFDTAPIIARTEEQAASINSAATEAKEIVTASLPGSTETLPTSAPEFVWPLRGKLLDSNVHGTQGVAISGRKGEPVRASADGIVAHADNNLESFGNTVIVRHNSGYVSTYAYLSDMVVNAGDDVVKGELIGFVGTSGDVDTPQLYFSVRQNNKAVNPARLLAK